MPHIVENVGLVFTTKNFVEIRDILKSNEKEVFARAGQIAPIDVHVPSGKWIGSDPEKASLFQDIQTKITIEIINDQKIIRKDEKVMFKMHCIIKSVFTTITYLYIFKFLINSQS